MKTIKIEGDVYVLSDEMEWSGPDDLFVRVLNFETSVLLENYSPAFGFPREYVYYSLLRLLPEIKKGIDDEELPKADKRIVY